MATSLGLSVCPLCRALQFAQPWPAPLAREFPTNLTAMVFGYKTKPNFTVENEKAIAVPPKVDFSKPAAKK